MSHCRIKIIIVLMILFLSSITAQNSDSLYSANDLINPKVPISLMSTIAKEQINPFETKINYPIIAGVGLTYSYIIYEINNYYANTWWRKDSTYIYNNKFNVVSDNTYARNIDKFGHAFGTALISHFISAGIEAGNVDEETCVWLGAIGGFGMQMYVEVRDGFSPTDKVTGKPKWGFSPGDAISNFIGASYFVAKYYYPFLNNFQLRASYFPSDALLDGKKPDNNYSDDYEGQKIWLAMRMKNLLPENLSEYWPSFLMLSVGYHVSNVGDYYDDPIETQYYLAFDFDAETIPIHGKFWNFVKNTLNYIHFPMPGIEISNKGISFGLFIF